MQRHPEPGEWYRVPRTAESGPHRTEAGLVLEERGRVPEKSLSSLVRGTRLLYPRALD